LAAGEQVVDIGGDALAGVVRRRRALLRIGLPLVGVGLVIGAILTIAVYSYRANSAGALALSSDLLDNLESRISLQVAAYLDPAARTAVLARDIVRDGGVTDDRRLAEVFAASALRRIPQITDYSFAAQGGNYMQVRRGAAPGGIDVKLIRNDPGPREVRWVHKDASGGVIGTDFDPTDTYDPRTRPWYLGALKTDGVYWTDVYVFYTDRAPGITAGLRYVADDGRVFVIGVDITLKTLSNFLASLQIGKTGRAMIVDSTGHLIAFPDPDRMLLQKDNQLVAARVDELNDPVITAAWDRYRIEGTGRRLIDVDGIRQISMVEALPVEGRDWRVMIVVPEADFTGFVLANNHTGLAMSVVVIVLVVLFALLLVRQGLRADRAARLVLDRGAAIGRQSAAFATLATEAGLFDPGSRTPPRRLTETLGEVTGARRAAVWRLLGAGALLRCEDSYERESGGHVAAMELSREEIPQFLAALAAGEEIDVADAAADRRTAGLHRVLMHPLGSRSLFCVPVRAQDRVVGAVWVEDAHPDAGAHDFVRAVANMVALRMAEAPSAMPARAEMAVSGAGDLPVRSFTAELALRGLQTEALAAEVFPAVAVAVLRFTDPAAIATRISESAIADHVACALQEIGHACQIPYLKLVGQDAIAAAGIDATDTDGPARIAAFALEARDRLAAVFEDADLNPAFRIGIDCGIAIGSAVGRGPRLFNLWGEAPRTADAMAVSAPQGGIQVTEAAYNRLRQHYLFRPRGSFYLPRVGAARTFILAGRL